MEKRQCPERQLHASDQRAIAARAANENLSPLDLMLAIMRDPHVAFRDRVERPGLSHNGLRLRDDNRQRNR